MSRWILLSLGAALSLPGCKKLLDQPLARPENREVPDDFGVRPDGGPTISAQEHWDTFFADPNLRALIETALENNQELNIALQEIIVAKNEVAGLKGEYKPSLGANVGVGGEKVGKHTSQGRSDEANGVPAVSPDFRFGLKASWEIDAWGKLRNAAKAAGMRYAATVEGKNFVVTEIIAELANAYYELVALDEKLLVLERNIAVQERALEVVKLQKQAARATELAVRKFQAEVYENRGRQYDLQQQRVEVENRINVLVGRYPQPVARDASAFEAKIPGSVRVGVPTELLDNRPDVRRAALELEAAKLDSRVAKARFYPSLSIEADVGYEAFNAKHLLDTPESMLLGLGGNLSAPLLNRAAIKADYRGANAMQIQAVLRFERTLLIAFSEVSTELARVRNTGRAFDRVAEQAEALGAATEASSVLYRSGRADYMEVLMTRRDALDAQMELIETRKARLQAIVGVYQALGGGWKR